MAAIAAWGRGLLVDVLDHLAGPHAFDVLDDDDRSREMIRRTVDSLRERLEP